MKQPIKNSLLGLAGVGILSLGLWSAANVHAATATTNTSTSTTATNVSERGPGSGRHLTDMAEILGMSTTELQTALDSGQEFYQIAAAKGVTYASLSAKQLAAYTAKLADMVKVGYLTQAESDTFLAQYKSQAALSPEGMPGMGFGHHGR